jgi:hypothetical protein
MTPRDEAAGSASPPSPWPTAAGGRVMLIHVYERTGYSGVCDCAWAMRASAAQTAAGTTSPAPWLKRPRPWRTSAVIDMAQGSVDP